VNWQKKNEPNLSKLQKW